MSLNPEDITCKNFQEFYKKILPYLNVGNGGTSDTPLGAVQFFDDIIAPAGWLIADGTVYNIADYPDLANQYERVHGSKNYWGGNGTTTFAVPDWQGEFLRASGTNSHTNQGSGANVGEHQDGTKHPYVGTEGDFAVGKDDARPENMDFNISRDNSWHYLRLTGAGSSSAGNWYTSRPTNTSLLLCIKAVPSSDIYTYSLTEKKVGTYADGKPIYQKTWTGLSVSLAYNNWVNVCAAPANIDKLLTVEAFMNANQRINLCSAGIEYGVFDGYIKAEYNASANIRTLTDFTIRYTKTTD